MEVDVVPTEREREPIWLLCLRQDLAARHMRGSLAIEGIHVSLESCLQQVRETWREEDR